MITTQKKIILALVVTVSLIALLGIIQQPSFAEEFKETQYTKANDVAIHTIFSFRDGIEKSDSFQVYNQISGFDKSIESPIFKLEGVMDFDRAYLYEAVDRTYYAGINNIQHNYGQFDVDVYLHKDDITLRHFKYSDCVISNYKVTTLFDKEEGWTTSKGFATIDTFEFECNGYKPNNPLFDLMKSNGYTSKQESSFDLRDTQNWSDLYTAP